MITLLEFSFGNSLTEPGPLAHPLPITLTAVLIKIGIELEPRIADYGRQSPRIQPVR